MENKKSEDKFSARPPFLGYLHQLRYALYLILKSENEDESIFIEKLDDIDINEDHLVQIKHHVDKVSLSNGSDDLWKTIRVWSTHLSDGNISLNDNLILTLITTAKATENSIAALLRNDDKRDPVKACKKLVDYTNSYEPRKEFEAFQKLTETQQKELVKKIIIMDNSLNISEIENKITKIFFQTINRKYRKKVFQTLSGWWEKHVIEHLQNDSKTPIKKYDVEQELCYIASVYGNDNDLYLHHIDDMCPIDIENDNRCFVTHLKKIIDLKSITRKKILEKAILYFHRAASERNDWLKTKGLIKKYDNQTDEITRYEERLKDKWVEKVGNVEDSNDGFSELNDKQKKKAGRKIFSKTCDLNIKIRKDVEQDYIMQGNYHILANEDRVAWHPDEILKILNEEDD